MKMGDIRLGKTGSTYVNQSVKEDWVLEILNASIMLLSPSWVG